MIFYNSFPKRSIIINDYFPSQEPAQNAMLLMWEQKPHVKDAMKTRPLPVQFV
jgi:hypothetical protein